MPWNPLWQMPVSTVLFCGWSRRVLGKYGVCTLFVAFLGVFWGAMRSTQRVARWIPPPPNPLNLFSLLIVSLCSFLFTATSLFLLTYLFPIGSDSGDGERRFAPNAPRNSWMLSVDISSLKGALWLRTSYFYRVGQLNRFYCVMVRVWRFVTFSDPMDIFGDRKPVRARVFTDAGMVILIYIQFYEKPFPLLW